MEVGCECCVVVLEVVCVTENDGRFVLVRCVSFAFVYPTGVLSQLNSDSSILSASPAHSSCMSTAMASSIAIWSAVDMSGEVDRVGLPETLDILGNGVDSYGSEVDVCGSSVEVCSGVVNVSCAAGLRDNVVVSGSGVDVMVDRDGVVEGGEVKVVL